MPDTKTPLAIGIHGAAGRMGLRLIHWIAEDPTLRLAAAIEHEGHPLQGQDPGPASGGSSTGVRVSTLSGCPGPLDVAIDFSKPDASMALVEHCRTRKVPLVIGTTGFDAEARSAISGAAGEIPILMSPNMSRAVNLLIRLAGEVARALGESADIEIVERHHRMKVDSPSGTALRLAEVAGRAVGSPRFIHGRSGQLGRRPVGEIGIHAVRGGDCPGDHSVIFSLLGETLELTHRAINRDGFARGALDAAKFLTGRPAGLYTMGDVLA